MQCSTAAAAALTGGQHQPGSSSQPSKQHGMGRGTVRAPRRTAITVPVCCTWCPCRMDHRLDLSFMPGEEHEFEGRRFRLARFVDCFESIGASVSGGRDRIELPTFVQVSLRLPPASEQASITLVLHGPPVSHPLVNTPLAVRMRPKPLDSLGFFLESEVLRQLLHSSAYSAGCITRASAAQELASDGQPLEGALPTLVLQCNPAAAQLLSMLCNANCEAMHALAARDSLMRRWSQDPDMSDGLPGPRSLSAARLVAYCRQESHEIASRLSRFSPLPLFCDCDGCEQLMPRLLCVVCGQRVYCSPECLLQDPHGCRVEAWRP